MSLFKRRFNPEKELNKIQNGNKKKTLIGIISLLVIIAIGSSFALYQVRNIQDIVYTKVGAFGDIVVSSTLDGSSGYVDKGNYTATVSCTNPGAATWDYKSWGIEISSFASKKTNCFINYTTNSSKTYLNNKVTSLVGNGQVFNENGIRYEGMNPNNYVWFNNELWRIIGVFDDTTHGVTGESLVKIIREKSIGGVAWDKSNTNDWSTASLMKLLNGAYLNQEDGTNGNYCFSYKSISKTHCDFTVIGLAEKYRNMVMENITWHLGSTESENFTAAEFYNTERASVTSNLNADIWPNTSTSIQTYPVGLLYTSDYGYASPESYCNRNTIISEYDENCTLYNWLNGENFMWTINVISSNTSKAILLNTSGNIQSYNTEAGFDIRPVLYLKSNTYIIDGDGSEANPYILAI